MKSRIVLAMAVAALASPALAGDMFPNYWDRYAVTMSNEAVPSDSDTSSFYRNQYAMLATNQARTEGTARSTPKTNARNVRGDAAAAQAPSSTHSACHCDASCGS